MKSSNRLEALLGSLGERIEEVENNPDWPELKRREPAVTAVMTQAEKFKATTDPRNEEEERACTEEAQAHVEALGGVLERLHAMRG